MLRFSNVIAILLMATAPTAVLAADKYHVEDHLQIVKTGDDRAAPVQPVGLTNDLNRDDIAAAQMCKDIGPASKDPDAEADIINICLARNSILNLKVVSSLAAVKARLR